MDAAISSPPSDGIYSQIPSSTPPPAPFLVKFFHHLFLACAVLLPGVAAPCVAQQPPGGYGLIAPWGTPAPDGQIVAPDQFELAPSHSPIGLGDPIDPITGLPLRMTSLADSDGSGQSSVIRDLTPTVPLPTDTRPALPGTPSTHRADTAQQRAGQTHMQPSPPGPVLRPDVLLPALPAPPENPLIPPTIIDPFQHKDLYQNRNRDWNNSRGPIVFEGGIETPPDDGDSLGFPTLPRPDPVIPLPRLDPPLFDAGNRDGELDWIDLIDEYAGRATRGDIPPEPHRTPHHDRSWLRIEHWRVDATSVADARDSFGLATFYGGITLGIPKIRGIAITPSISWHESMGTAKTALAEQLYDLQVRASWMHQLDDRWRMRVEVGGGLYSEFDVELDDELDAFRATGLSLMTYEWHRDVQVVFGAAYLNLENRDFMPVGGIIWQPDNRLQLEIVYPEGKLAVLVQHEREGEIWAYVGGGFYGRTWRVVRNTGLEDDATYSDWRIYVGGEKQHISGTTYFVEAGYSFERELEFGSSVGDFEPKSVLMLRGGLHF